MGNIFTRLHHAREAVRRPIQDSLEGLRALAKLRAQSEDRREVEAA